MTWILIILFAPLLIALTVFLWAMIDIDASVFTSSKKKRSQTPVPKKKEKSEEELYPKEILLVRDMLKGIMREGDIKDWTCGVKNEFSSSPFYTHEPTGIAFEMWKYWVYLILPDGTRNPKEIKYGKDDDKTKPVFKLCSEFINEYDNYITNKEHRDTLQKMCEILEEKLDLPKVPVGGGGGIEPNAQALLGYSGSMIPNPYYQMMEQEKERRLQSVDAQISLNNRDMQKTAWNTKQRMMEEDLFKTLTGRA